MDDEEFRRIAKRFTRIVDLQKDILGMYFGTGEFTGLPRQISAHMFEGLQEEAGLILNDSVFNCWFCDTPTCPNTFWMEGERTGKLKVKPYDTGITIENEKRDSLMYYTLTAPPVVRANDILKHLWPEHVLGFVYGITDRKHLYADCLHYFGKHATLNAYSALIVKTSSAKLSSNIIMYEFLWNDGEIYTLNWSLDKSVVTITECVKVEKSVLPDFSF